MPELPEVECIRRGLDAAILGERIVEVSVQREDVVKAVGKSTQSRAQALGLNRTITGTSRHGKRLALLLSNDTCIEVRLGMSGLLLLGDDAIAVSAHAHVAWRLAGGRFLVFRDPRRFGGITCMTSAELHASWERLGPDALSVTNQGFQAAVSRTSRAIKAAIMDQACLAGVGNIYADEALFLAGVRPDRRADACSRDQLGAIAEAVRRVLSEAIIAGGSTIRDYARPDGSAGGFAHAHRVYGRSGLACTTCGTTLESGNIAQRTTVWCPRCQA